jgi:hypothetical protein
MANCKTRERLLGFRRSCQDGAVRDLTVLLLHLLAIVARLAGPGGARCVVAESLLLKQQLLILNRSKETVGAGWSVAPSSSNPQPC